MLQLLWCHCLIPLLDKQQYHPAFCREAASGYTATLCFHSPLATRHSPLATRHSPLATNHCLPRVPQNPVDFGENLFVVKVGAGDDAGRAGGDARAAALAQRGYHPADVLLLVELDGVVGAYIVANPAAGAPSSSSRHDRLDVTVPLVIMPAMRAAGRAPWPPKPGCPRPWQTRRRTRVGHRGHGSSFGWRSVYQPAILHEMPHLRPNSLASAAAPARHQNDHIDRDSFLTADHVSSTCTISLPFRPVFGRRRSLRPLCR